ncbi:MAG: TIGR01458 family HAD-type hydrolase [Acidobacteriota bacterium]|jgi:HAD superfamily hydrolase (TIGR01458 family)|nr:TIGR01458 family HAD-type hydrolase [Acidobacteriota bacterium]
MNGILFDLDGVVYNSETPIAGAAEALARIRERGIPHLFVTNTSSRGREALVEKLGRFGIPTAAEQIVTPCVAAAEWLRTRQAGQAGDSAALFLAPKARADFSGVRCLPEDAESGARFVVVGDMGERWDYRSLNRAFRLLHSDPESVLVALGMTRFWLGEDGLRLDAAPFVAALECATGRRAVVLGKPAASFFGLAVQKLGVPASEVAMVGDDIVTDIGGAKRAGLKAILLRTGKYRPADLDGVADGDRPDAVLDSIRDLPDFAM